MSYRDRMAGLTLRFERDDDGDVKLFAALQVGGFAGESQYWCPPSEFSSLIDDLEQYPISTERPVRGDWAGGIRLEIKPVATAGLLEAKASITDFAEIRNHCEAVFTCHYADLNAFRLGLLEVVPLGEGEAILAAS